jgi:O-antigen ligase
MQPTEKQTYINKVVLVLFSLTLITIALGKIFTFEYSGFTVKPVYFAAIALILYFVYLALSKKTKVKLDLMEIALYAFVFLSFVSIGWSIAPTNTFIYSMMIFFMALTFSATRGLADVRFFEIYFNTFIVLGVFTALFGLWQFFADTYGYSEKYTLLTSIYTKSVFGFPRVQSTFFEPGFYANFLMIPIFLNIYQLLRSKKNIYYASFFVTIIAFFLTLSRGGYYSLAFALLILFVMIILKFREHLKKTLLIIALSAIALFTVSKIIYYTSGAEGIFNFRIQSARVDDLLVYKGEESEVGVTRSYTIKVALDNWKKRPFGIGAGAFGMLPEFEKIRSQGNMRQTVNSIYPEILVEEGIQGFILFVLFVVLALFHLFKDASREKNFLSLIFFCTLIAIFTQFVTFSTLYLVYIWVFTGFAMAYIDSQKKQLIK